MAYRVAKQLNAPAESTSWRRSGARSSPTEEKKLRNFHNRKINVLSEAIKSLYFWLADQTSPKEEMEERSQ
ncbi:MAG: hypothetical protein A2785_00810 [Candidatus Chisholmbacteria bacterium RIFCSPHIGHO2_01_FULL_49_18]|uniref:Uncharacterized protein n=2 Tax=Candidatus Chisholmiibacteriota TaxID=1817900 RepID=A0A1G1VL75_9BACT|nr:MAG: hypothetical protein A2785_00810 [Candidatus Chisholmbacteria bacterium RIFCSPHIGHO2_01_FULL_49_18]OGY22210.1 MAG: hypothetical protein A3A65_04940 [Candidatus Chisholmbacteria bacterium RIFCSPLOWO2_01_FULL_49_14]